MNLESLNLDEPMDEATRTFIRLAYHEQVKEWVREAVVYPLTLLVSYVSIFLLLDKLL